MLKNLFTLFLVLVLFSALNAQEKTYLRPDGKFYRSDKTPTSLEVMKVKHVKPGARMDNSEALLFKPSNVNGLLDTLGYNDGSFNTNFGTDGQDVYLQWFKVPADLTIKGFAFQCTDDQGVTNYSAGFEGKIVSVSMPTDSLANVPEARWGYYEASGNGYNDATAFQDNPDITGSWVSVGGHGAPFGADIWSDGGYGAPITPVNDGSYQWINTNLLFEPQLTEGEVFGIVYKHTGVTLGLTDDRLGVLSGSGAGNDAFKYYAYQRLAAGDYGWWSRSYTWDFLVAVDITGNTPPTIESFTTLPSGLDVGPYTVDAVITDQNVGNPSNAGVASASLFWSIDGQTTWNEVTMTGTEPNFSAVIPAQVPGTTVDYYLEATDLDGKTIVSVTKSFYIFAATPGVNTLIVFNGLSGVTGYPQTYYFGSGDWPNSYSRFDFAHDSWAYGALTAGVVNNYTNIIEITANGPNVINNDVIKAWLDADGGHNYLLAGDEWLGSQSNWTDGPHAAGDFIFDVLGVNYEYNDINYAATGDQNLPSVVYPQSGSALGGPIFDKYTQVSTDSGWTAPMTYDPYFEISVANWLDGVDFESDVVVDMKGLAVDGTTQYNIGGHRTLPAGNKIAFFTFDPLSLDSDTENQIEYYWYGFLSTAPQVEALKWFGYTTDVRKTGNNIPKEFNISQNYPNPFNPSTTIDFALPQASNVVIKVYNILGAEVATLLNSEKAAGRYQINWNASSLASGIYFYTINAGNFTSTKKMILMK